MTCHVTVNVPSLRTSGEYAGTCGSSCPCHEERKLEKVQGLHTLDQGQV